MLLRGDKAIELAYEGTSCTLCGTSIGVLHQQREGSLPWPACIQGPLWCGESILVLLGCLILSCWVGLSACQTKYVIYSCFWSGIYRMVTLDCPVSVWWRTAGMGRATVPIWLSRLLSTLRLVSFLYVKEQFRTILMDITPFHEILVSTSDQEVQILALEAHGFVISFLTAKCYAGRVIPESVVYSFGTILLDLLSGKHIPPSHVSYPTLCLSTTPV